MAWEVRDGLVRVGMPDETPDATRLRYFDVNDADLFALPRVGRGALVRAIRTLIDPEVWESEFASLDLKKGVLIARAPPATLEKIEAYLEMLRRAESPSPRRS